MYKKAVVSYLKRLHEVNHPKYDITIEKDSDDKQIRSWLVKQ